MRPAKRRKISPVFKRKLKFNNLSLYSIDYIFSFVQIKIKIFDVFFDNFSPVLGLIYQKDLVIFLQMNLVIKEFHGYYHSKNNIIRLYNYIKISLPENMSIFSLHSCLNFRLSYLEIKTRLTFLSIFVKENRCKKLFLKYPSYKTLQICLLNFNPKGTIILKKCDSMIFEGIISYYYYLFLAEGNVPTLKLIENHLKNKLLTEFRINCTGIYVKHIIYFIKEREDNIDAMSKTLILSIKDRIATISKNTFARWAGREKLYRTDLKKTIRFKYETAIIPLKFKQYVN